MRRYLNQRNIGRLGCVILVCASAAAPSTLHAGEKEECISAYEQSQVLRKQSRLLLAHEKILICSRASCPPMLREDCSKWLDDVERATPSVVFQVKGKDGKDVVDVKVTMDGKPLTDRIDGKPVSVDPGQHTFTFEIPGSPRKEEKTVIPEGAKNRQILISFAVAPPPSAATLRPVLPPEDRVPTATYVLGGLGAVGLISFGVFGMTGLSKEADLENQACKPHCSQSDVDSAKRAYLISDISLGVGVASLTAASVLYFTRPRASAEPTPTPVSFRLVPTANGGFASVGGHF